MRKKNINFELQGRVRKYLAYTLQKDCNIEEENEILDKLNYALKKELILQSNEKFISQTPMLSRNFSSKTLELLALSIQSVRFSPGEFIFHVFFFYFHIRNIRIFI